MKEVIDSSILYGDEHLVQKLNGQHLALPELTIREFLQKMQYPTALKLDVIIGFYEFLNRFAAADYRDSIFEGRNWESFATIEMGDIDPRGKNAIRRGFCLAALLIMEMRNFLPEAFDRQVKEIVDDLYREARRAQTDLEERGSLDVL